MDHDDDGQWQYDDDGRWWQCDGMRQRWTMTTTDHDDNGRWQITMLVGWWRWRDGGEQWRRKWRRFLFNNQQGRGMPMMDDDDKTTMMEDDDDDDGPRQWWTMTIQWWWTMMTMWWDETTTMDHNDNGRWQMMMMVGWWRWRDRGELWPQLSLNLNQSAPFHYSNSFPSHSFFCSFRRGQLSSFVVVVVVHIRLHAECCI